MTPFSFGAGNANHCCVHNLAQLRSHAANQIHLEETENRPPVAFFPAYPLPHQPVLDFSVSVCQPLSLPC